MTLGELINKYRSKNGLSMDAFANKSGISKAYISLLEKNKHPKTGKPISPSIQCIKQAADAMNMDFNVLLSKINTNDETNSGNLSDLEWKYPSVSNRLGNILNNYRRKEKLTVAEFASQLDISSDLCTGIETGKYEPTFELLKKIADITHYKIDYLTGALDHISISTDKTIDFYGTKAAVKEFEGNYHFKSRFEELCLQESINQDNTEKCLGLDKQTFMDIRQNRMPTLPELLKISYAFGVSMDYLIGKTDIRMSSLDSDELELILDYRDCPSVYKENIRKRAHDLSIDAMLKNEKPSVAADDLGKTGTDNLGK